MSASIKTATLNGVATIEIARPEKKNALTQAMYIALAEALQAADQDAAVRAILITGQPGIFCSGNDLEDFTAQPSLEPDGPARRFMQALSDARKPVIAGVTGAALGIGCTMLLHCDLVYIADDARLAMPFVSLGLVPEYASTVLVPWRVGPQRAAELLLLGDPFTAEQAVEYGMANAVLPAPEVLRHARRMAERFNALPATAVQASKALLRRPSRDAVFGAITAEMEILRERFRSPEFDEALQAFFEKRKPDFSKF